MYRRGYQPAISIGPIVAVGGLAMLIPPSSLAVLLGCFMDQVSMMLIIVPMFLPVVEAIGYDTIAFGVLMLMVFEISLATLPPACSRS